MWPVYSAKGREKLHLALERRCVIGACYKSHEVAYSASLDHPVKLKLPMQLSRNPDRDRGGYDMHTETRGYSGRSLVDLDAS